MSDEKGKAPMKAFHRDPNSCSQQQHDDHSPAKDSTLAASNDKDSVIKKTEADLQALPHGGAAHKAVGP